MSPAKQILLVHHKNSVKKLVKMEKVISIVVKRDFREFANQSGSKITFTPKESYVLTL